ncbi:membrane protein [Skermanella stibiiresistens SB22]|uniref:Membrane protein n=1 Tax=Skermanella stibiiresistens SB22 TaxID=1385369 RepID=W9GWP8_9PROT|nr:cupin domain-containing protein [Skermanella stibiiresistens]EWY38325.1 membrane protein [Skermanella stibiiresistens SB22]
MRIVRLADAPAYEAPGHALMRMARLQGREAGPSTSLWLGLSRIAPGGGTTLDASALEKMYVVLEGEVVISNGREEATLHPWDSCRIAPHEERRLANLTDREAVILLAMPV